MASQPADYIVSDAAIMGGVSCFRGTRVPVALVFENLADGLTIAEIVELWPSLDAAIVREIVGMAGERLAREAARAA